MVLDVKFGDWAAAQQLDTNKLKAAKVPIYGKWYFPTIPADVQLVRCHIGSGHVVRNHRHTVGPRCAGCVSNFVAAYRFGWRHRFCLRWYRIRSRTMDSTE